MLSNDIIKKMTVEEMQKYIIILQDALEKRQNQVVNKDRLIGVYENIIDIKNTGFDTDKQASNATGWLNYTVNEMQNKYVIGAVEEDDNE